MYVFEIRDVTDDEAYYTTGIYSTLELALAELGQPEPPETYHDMHWWDVFTFKICRRPVDQYSERGTEVASVTWTRLPIEDDDEYQRWERTVKSEALAGEE